MKITPKIVVIGSLICATLALLIAWGMNAWMGLLPCHLCLLQRVFYALIGGTSLLTLILGIERIGLFLNIFFASLGLLLAAWQSWLQHFPSTEVPSCLPPFSTLFKLFSPLEALMEVLKGSSDCSIVDWSFLGLSIAEYSVILFLLLLYFNIYSLWDQIKIKR